MAFVYNPDETPIQNATRGISDILQTIHNHPNDTPIEKIETDLEVISEILENAKIEK